MENLDLDFINDFIRQALAEDVGDGDHTSLACIDADAPGVARLLFKDDGIIAGVKMAELIFKHVDPNARLEIQHHDGAELSYGTEAFRVYSTRQAILKAERLVLNTMQRMSGIATFTKKFTDQVKDLPVQVLDTRKTTPLLRYFEKWAVLIGGGTNYRYGLFDRIMVKDNHIDFCGGITQAINRVQDYLKANNKDLQITLEVRNMKELAEVLKTGQVNRIMLDNFTPEQIVEAIKVIDGRFETEASGGIDLSTIRAYGETGVDFISVGALTHSYQSLDISLKSVKS